MEIHSNYPEEDSTSSLGYIYWILLAITSLAPVIIFIIIAARHPAILHMLRSPLRYRSYGLRMLERHGNPKYLLCYFLMYRHRPLLMDLIKVAVEIAFVSHFFNQGVTIRGPLITWCIYDVIVVMFLFNLKELKGRYGSGHGARIAYWIFIVYSVALGFPMGTTSKILWIVHNDEVLLFHYVVLPYFFGCCCLVAATIFYLIPTTCCTTFRRDATVGQFSTRLYLILFVFAMAMAWGWVFLNVEYCKVPNKLTLEKTWFSEDSCPHSLDSYSAAFLPISIILVGFNLYLSYMATIEGLLWRFLPEVVSIWSASITFLTSMYHLDKNDNRILFASIMVLGLSSIVTLMCNMSLSYVVHYTVRYVIPRREQEIAAGRRSRHFTEDQKKKNRQMREAMLSNFLKSKGILEDNDASKSKNKEEKKKNATLKGTLFRQMWVQSRDQMSRCCICFEEYTGDKEGIVLAIIKKCGHYFHYECVWDWLEKRPTCPMCRQPVDLDETGVQVLSYYDIKHAVRKNRPADAEDGRSAISSSINTVIQTQAAVEEGDSSRTVEAQVPESKTEQSNADKPSTLPPASLQPIIVSMTRSNTEISSPHSTFVNIPSSPQERLGPLPPIPSTSSQEVPNNQPILAVVNIRADSQDNRITENNQNRNRTQRTTSESMAPEVSSQQSRRRRAMSESSSRGEKNKKQTGDKKNANEVRIVANHRQLSQSRDVYQHGEQKPRKKQPPGGVNTRPQPQAQYEWQEAPKQHQQQRQQREKQKQPSIPPPHTSQITPPQDTPHARGKRQSRRRCEICGRRYEGDPRDIVVGYVRGCGHFYHSLCLDGYVRKHETCPRCHYERKELNKRGQATPPGRRVIASDLFLAFLLDILRDSDADGTESSLTNGSASQPRGHQNRGYITETSRF